MLWNTSPAGVWVRHTPVSLLLPQPIGLALVQQAVEKPFQTAELLGQKENTPQDAQKGQTSHPPNPDGISPARPESANTDSSPQDAPHPMQGRSSETDYRFTFYASRFTVPGSAARTPLADFFSIRLDG